MSIVAGDDFSASELPIPLSASLCLFPSFYLQNDELCFGFVLGLTPLTKFDQIFFAAEARKPLCE